jgi:hypothetical protein
MASQSQLRMTRSLCLFVKTQKVLEVKKRIWREREKGMGSNEDKLCTQLSLRLGLTEN